MISPGGTVSGALPPQPVPLCLACQASRRLWLDFQSALGHGLSAIDADSVAAVLQPDQSVEHQQPAGLGRGENGLGAVRLGQVGARVRRILGIVGDERMLLMRSVQHRDRAVEFVAYIFKALSRGCDIQPAHTRSASKTSGIAPTS